MRMLEMHIGVRDLDAAVAFYSALLPHERVITNSDNKQKFLVFADGSAFGIWEAGYRGLHDCLAAAHLHFAFQIAPDQYDSYKEKLEALGVDVIEHRWHDGQRSLYFFDTDGHQGEFMTKGWL